jgi:excisionase family DNA binding protein
VLEAAAAEPSPAVTVVEDDMPRMPALLTPQEVADRLHVTRVTVLKYIREGFLPAYTSVKPFQIRSEDYQYFRREVFPSLGSGKHGRPSGAKGKSVTANMLKLALEVEKLMGHRR